MRFLLFVLLASLTRTIFQFYFLPLFFLYTHISVNNIRIHKSGFKRALCYSFLLFLTILPIKQKLFFDTFFTTSFAGQHKLEGIWYRPTAEELQKIDVPERILMNGSLFESKWNSSEQLITNYKYEEIFNRLIFERPEIVGNGLKRSALQGIQKIFKPTQDYSDNKLIQFLPWNDYYHSLSGGKTYLVLLIFCLLSFFFLLIKREIQINYTFIFLIFYIGTILVVIIIGTNRYEWTEIERLKFLIEPLFFVLSVGAIAHFIQFLFSHYLNDQASRKSDA